jgi:hypothetical protein
MIHAVESIAITQAGDVECGVTLEGWLVPRAGCHSERPQLSTLLHINVAVTTTDEPLGVENRAGRPHTQLVLRYVPYHPFAVSECHEGGHAAVGLLVEDDAHATARAYAHTAAFGNKIASDGM